MVQQLRAATLLLIAMTVVTGGIYPLVVTAIGQMVFPSQAKGGLIVRSEEIVGAELIGQSFTRPEYFWGRLSATSNFAYNAAASSGSNFGPLHPGLKVAAEARIVALRTAGSPGENIPVDLVTTSASGLDPHISPAAAEFQVARIAVSRKIPEATVRDLVRRYTKGRQLGVLGEPRVNVLQLNLALDQLNRD